jgi:hypothetical protein
MDFNNKYFAPLWNASIVHLVGARSGLMETTAGIAMIIGMDVVALVRNGACSGVLWG